MSYTNRLHNVSRDAGMQGEGRTKPTKAQLFRVGVLIEELEKVRKSTPSPKFNMKSWCTLHRAATKTFLKKLIGQAVKNPCGTTACLAGKAGLLPKIRRMGFRWEVMRPKSYRQRGHPAHAGFRYKHNIEVNAVKKFFGTMCYWEVFMNIYGINTLLQGIDALKRFHKRESRAHE